MNNNTFGDKWSFTSFGESHGAAVGGVLDGVPAGLHIDMNLIREELARRAGKHSTLNTQHSTPFSPSERGSGGVPTPPVSPRALREPDEVEWLSGVINDNSQLSTVNFQLHSTLNTQHSTALVTLGTPIAFIIRNKDARPEDYEWLKHSYRTGHADKVYELKYGIRDWRGGGRASARETAARVVAGCIAKQHLAAKGVHIHARLVQVGSETDPARFAQTIADYQRQGDSIGGIVECTVTGLPAGTGEPLFHKLQAELAFAVMSINACKGFEYGTGFAGVTQPGSAINHLSGGIAGGISDGTPLTFRAVFKPTPSTPKALANVQGDDVPCTNVQGDDVQCTKVGRHDPCVAVRAVPVVEAMTALALVNFL